MTRTFALAAALGCLVACGQPPPAAEAPASASTDPFAGRRWVDLSHAYDAETIFWPTGEAFKHIQTAWGETEKGTSTRPMTSR